MNQPEVNLRAIRSGTVLIEKGALLPEPVHLEDGVMGNVWAPIAEDPERRKMAIQKALLRLIAAVKHENCNALEIDHVELGCFWGFPYVSVSAHPRHIQRGLVLGSAT